MVGIIENPYLKYILNRMARELRSRRKMIGSVNEEHVRAGHKLLWRESLWKQMHCHHERRVGVPVHQMECNIACGVGRVVGRQRTRQRATRRLRAWLAKPSDALTGQLPENGFDLLLDCIMGATHVMRE